MALNVYSDALYLTEPNTRSQAEGHFFILGNSKDPKDNGAILNIAKIIKNAMSSAVKAKVGALFMYLC